MELEKCERYQIATRISVSSSLALPVILKEIVSLNGNMTVSDELSAFSLRPLSEELTHYSFKYLSESCNLLNELHNSYFLLNTNGAFSIVQAQNSNIHTTCRREDTQILSDSCNSCKLLNDSFTLDFGEFRFNQV